MKVRVHVGLKPNDGKEPFVVETDLEVPSYGAAWSAVSGIARKFDSTLSYHKIEELNEDGTARREGQVVQYPLTRPPLSLPAPHAAAAAEARLPGNVAARTPWTDSFVLPGFSVVPFPDTTLPTEASPP